MVLFLFLFACRDQCVPEVRGPDPELNAVVERSVEEFYAAIGELEICVPRVTVRDPLYWGAVGSYNAVTRGVRVSDEYERTSIVEEIANHELCHAVVRQTSVFDARDPRWSAIADGTRVNNAEHAFVYTCELGPRAAEIYGHACGTDRFEHDAFDALLEVFTERLGPEPVTGAWTPQGSYTFDEPVGRLFPVVPKGEVLGITVSLAGRLHRVAVDRATGEELPLEPGLLPELSDAIQAGFREKSRATLGDVDLVTARAQASDGGAARRLYLDGPDGIVPAGCAENQEVAFTVGDSFWTAWVDGDTVRWGTWEVSSLDDRPAGPSGTGSTAAGAPL